MNNKPPAVYGKAITLQYFQSVSKLTVKSPEVIKLRDYFESALMKELKQQNTFANSFHLVSKPTADAYTVEIALLSATPTRITNNAA